MTTFTIKNKLDIPYVDEDFDDFIYNELTILNPKWIENNYMNRYNWNTPKELHFYEKVGENGLSTPRGFLINIIEYCKNKNIKFEIDNQTHVFEDVDFEFSGRLHSFQEAAIDKMLSENEGVLCAPTGSGKTVMGIFMIARRKQPTLIVMHTKELLHQWKSRIRQFLNVPDRRIGKIGDGNLDENKPITVALVQTLHKYSEIIDQYSHLIIDECHRVPSKTFTDIAGKFKGKFITGLSATPFRRDGLSKAIEWYAGPILHTIPPKDLIKTGHITNIQSVIRKTNFISSLKDPAAEYSRLLQELSQNKERNKMIINDIVSAVAAGETCLVLSDRKMHCRELKKLVLKESDIPTAILTGDVPSAPRKQIVERINNGKIKVLIATGQLIGEGFDCRNLSALFLTLPIKFSGRIIQYLGRVLRPTRSKDKALIYDYFDPNIRCLYPGMKNRKKEYKKLEV